MKSVMTIIKKELARVFKDKRLLITLLIPGIIIYGLYSFMGSAMQNSDKEDREATYHIVTVNLSSQVDAILQSPQLELNAVFTNLTQTDSTQFDSIVSQREDMLMNGELDIIIIFQPNFDDVMSPSYVPYVKVYYNPSLGSSSYAYQKVVTALEVHRASILSQRLENYEIFEQSVVAVYDQRAAAGKGFAMLLPMLVLTFLFSGCSAVAPDSIAGEKERGTIATILITPIKRSQLAMGKVIAISILASLSALSSFIGLMLSLPKLMGNDASLEGLYGAGEYLLILLVLISTVLLIVGVMSILSSLAKTVKEAGMLIMPLMFLSMLVGLTSMLDGTASANVLIYLVPLYNSVQALVSILTFDFSIVNLIVCFVSNIVYLGGAILLLNTLFNNERIMFAK